MSEDLKYSIFKYILVFATVAYLILSFRLLSIGDESRFFFAIGVTMTLYSLLHSIDAKTMARRYQREALHQAIGGYIPTKQLNDLIRLQFFKNGGTISRDKSEDYVTKRRDTEKLLNLVDSYKITKNISKQIVLCEIERNGSVFSAISVNEEMAICIAFLKSCGEDTDQEFK